MKKIVAVALALVGFTIWKAGCWDSSSPRYWRHYGQSGLFAIAHSVPTRAETRKVKASLARLALKTHRSGITSDELELSSSILAEAGFSKEAASLLMALVRLVLDNNDSALARNYAAKSAELHSDESTLLNLIALNQHDIEARSRWVVKLQTDYPNAEVGQAYHCLGAYRNLSVEVPAPCQRPLWVQRIAVARHREYLRLNDLVEHYPDWARQEIQALETEIETRQADMVRYSAALNTVRTEASGLGAAAIVEVGLDILPIPKAGDTLETFVVREGACALPLLRWACRISSVGQAVDRMNKRGASLNERASNLSELLRLNDSLMGYRRDAIEEWSSGRKLEGFRQELHSQHGRLWSEIETEVYRNSPPIGISLDTALNGIQ